ncbi:hypothetical protein DFH11DRAFT_188771 [Phellopilus nigrolimitatus]|nr:hypothetical protein DFH11DRAFT_188771 [Phellopilus nigrolimitatus]
MAPTPDAATGTTPGPESSQASSQGGGFHATPTAAVVVPVVLIMLLMIAAVLAILYIHRRRRNDRDRLIFAETTKTRPKQLPGWLSNWTGSRPVSVSDPNKPGFLVDEDSDAIALRPVSVSTGPLPRPPRPVYDPHDAIRPKKLAVGTRIF